MANGSGSNWCSSVKASGRKDPSLGYQIRLGRYRILYLAACRSHRRKRQTIPVRGTSESPGPGVAGASFDRRRIWNGNWSSQWQDENQTLDAITEHFRFHLQLSPDKPFVIQGENGVSQKAEGSGRASHYISFPRLGVSGTINIPPVSGTAWMDHEWFTEQLAPDQVGWDWFSVQLDNHTELMLFATAPQRRFDRPLFIGHVHRCARRRETPAGAASSLQPLSYWHKYPVEWRLRVPVFEYRSDLPRGAAGSGNCAEALNYWEGAVDYSGTQKGVGYVEMTGYEGQVKAASVIIEPESAGFSNVYKVMVGSIGPRPIAFVSTVSPQRHLQSRAHSVFSPRPA